MLTSLHTSIMNFISQKFRDFVVMSQMFISKSWIWEVSTADPLSSSQAFLFVLPAYHSPKIFIAHLYQYRTGQPWDSIIQYFSFFHCAFWLTKRPVRSHVIYCVSWIGHTVPKPHNDNSHNNSQGDSRNAHACLHIQIHLCNTKLKLSH